MTWEQADSAAVFSVVIHDPPTRDTTVSQIHKVSPACSTMLVKLITQTFSVIVKTTDTLLERARVVTDQKVITRFSSEYCTLS